MYSDDDYHPNMVWKGRVSGHTVSTTKLTASDQLWYETCAMCGLGDGLTAPIATWHGWCSFWISLLVLRDTHQKALYTLPFSPETLDNVKQISRIKVCYEMVLENVGFWTTLIHRPLSLCIVTGVKRFSWNNGFV